MTPFCVFYATRTALVWANNIESAYDEFITLMFDHSADGHKLVGGRLAPPTRDEVVIRELREIDRGWIEELDGPAARKFLQALEKADAR